MVSTSTISRRIAARSEIETSIKLFLSHRDPISAHILAWAAVDVLRGVGISQEISTMSGHFERWMGPDMTKTYYQSAKREYNFFKHSDRDPDAQLKNFNAEETARVLIRACIDYRNVYGQMTWSMYMFSQWYLCRNPECIKAEFREAMKIVTEILHHPNNSTFEDSTVETLAMINEGKERGNLVLRNFPDLLEP
jgi:hypothetical protein